LGCKNRGDRVGLCQVLRGEVAPADALLKASGMELYLLPSGGRPNNPVELLSSPNWELALRTLAASFDWVLVDSPPILGMADTMLLSALADFILLVIRSEFTPGSLIQEAVQRIGQEKISGIAMNRINKSRRARYYQYYAAYSSERQA
jgi:Mrp family chromosome partitioning ATPase